MSDKIRLIIRHFGTVQTGPDDWKDATRYITVEATVPEWLVEGMKVGSRSVANGQMQIVGAELIGGDPTEHKPGEVKL